MTRPEHDAHVMHTYTNSDWGTCVKTRPSFGGAVLRLAGAPLRTNARSNLPLLALLPKQSSWLHMPQAL